MYVVYTLHLLWTQMAEVEMCVHENTKQINKSKKVAIKILAETLIILSKMSPLVHN